MCCMSRGSVTEAETLSVIHTESERESGIQVLIPFASSNER